MSWLFLQRGPERGVREIEVRGRRGAGWQFGDLRSWAWLAPLLQTPTSAAVEQEKMGELFRLEAEYKGQAWPSPDPGPHASLASSRWRGEAQRPRG